MEGWRNACRIMYGRVKEETAKQQFLENAQRLNATIWESLYNYLCFSPKRRYIRAIFFVDVAWPTSSRKKRDLVARPSKRRRYMTDRPRVSHSGFGLATPSQSAKREKKRCLDRLQEGDSFYDAFFECCSDYTFHICT